MLGPIPNQIVIIINNIMKTMQQAIVVCVQDPVQNRRKKRDKNRDFNRVWARAPKFTGTPATLIAEVIHCQ